ncbi:MAG: alpha/beta hydrolase [Roseovarius sp.]|uniref:alpha/beta fold hydrolase n=1 Tax=Roseovarius sp. TaxID=1486281 RepID=UPI0032F004DE
MVETCRQIGIAKSDTVEIETIMEGEGPTLVILPSMGRDGYGDYDETVQHLVTRGLRVLRPQPRGIGSSRGPMESVGLEDLADDIALVIQRLSDGPAVIVGHAFGHFVARMCALRHPDKVRGVVLAASAASDTHLRFPEVWTAPDIACDLSRPKGDRLSALETAFFAPGNDASEWLEGWYPETHRMQLAAEVPPGNWWSAGYAPLLELIAEYDPFKPKDRWGELGETFGPRVTSVVIEGASHALFPEQPETCATAIADWVFALLQVPSKPA